MRSRNQTIFFLEQLQPQNREGALYYARILACFGEYDDDVVLLQPIGVSLTLPPEEIAILGAAELSEGNIFTSYGYPMQGRTLDTNLEGTILGSIEPPESEDLHLQAYPLQLSSEDIDRGSSGAAVLDFERNLAYPNLTGLSGGRFMNDQVLMSFLKKP